MIVDTRNSAFDFAPIRTTLTLGEIEEKISNKFNKDITAEVNQIAYIILNDKKRYCSTYVTLQFSLMKL